MASNLSETFFNLIETGFENYYNLSGTCQFLITAEQLTAFFITIDGKESTYSLGLHQAPAVTVEMSASYFESMIINNRTIDFDIPEFFAPITCSGDKYFALELTRAIMRPHPMVEAKFKKAEQLSGLSELTDIERIKRPSAALVAEKISQGIPFVATHCLSEWKTSSTNLDDLESLFGNIAVKSKPSQKINTIADLFALMRTPPNPAGAFTKMTILSEAEESIFPAPAILNDFNVAGAP